MKIVENAILVVLACSVIVQGQEAPNFLDKSCSIIPIEEPRIIGGRNAKINSTPWMAMILDENGYRCGGSLITNLFVLTAAHCTGDTKLKVRLGQYRLEWNCRGVNCLGSAQEFTVGATYIHSEYSRGSHDIALLKLDTRVQFTNRIRPICLLMDPLFRHLDDHIIKFRTYGWGQTESGELGQVIQTTSLYNLPRANCFRQYRFNVIDGNHICAERATAGTCKGDSGGPLTAIVKYAHRDTIFQFGIVSAGEKTCEKASIFTNVMAHLNWIESIVRREENF
ncbi:serine protease grass [Drosophila rhopaloa]|uniref:Peptidase S1 domain-containing protein n=1 Tax=Drosophila rhopaloa TaxID=1041015 RepID=A0ABM5I0E9_DRORH|nr:serine protease grass [Drosophila rhopaloa]